MCCSEFSKLPVLRSTCIKQRLQRLETLSHSLSLNSVFFLFITLPRPLACKIMGYTLRLYEAGAKMELRWIEELVEVDSRDSIYVVRNKYVRVLIRCAKVFFRTAY